MSRVRSLMVSRVMELFWRRCLHVERENLSLTSDKLLFFLLPNINYLLQSYQKYEPLPTEIRATISLTLLLSCWTASYQRWMRQNNRKKGQEKDRGKRLMVFVLSTPHPSLYLLVLEPHRQKGMFTNKSLDFCGN